MTQPDTRSSISMLANAAWWLTVVTAVVVFGIALGDVWTDATRYGFGETMAMFGDGYFSLRTGELAALQDLGLDRTAYAGFLVARQLFLFGASLVVALVIWRRVRTWVALYVTLFLVTGNLMVLFDGVPSLGFVGPLLLGMSTVSLLGLLYVFPDGRHARPFALLVGGGVLFIAVGWAATDSEFFWVYSIYPAGIIIAGGVILQLRRIWSAGGRGGPHYSLLATYLLAVAVLFVADQLVPSRADAGLAELLWRLTIESVVLAVPLVMGLVIVWWVVRHGFGDVELAVNRTAVYAALSALLAAVYVLAVLVTQAVLRQVTGIDGGNTFGVITATALIALVVLPAQRKIQAGIDRLFFRRRYDMARTLASFSERVQSRENLGEIGGELAAIADDTFQPERVVLLLPRPQEGGT